MKDKVLAKLAATRRRIAKKYPEALRYDEGEVVTFEGHRAVIDKLVKTANAGRLYHVTVKGRKGTYIAFAADLKPRKG